jgi:PAS domain S-box-containing protein
LVEDASRVLADHTHLLDLIESQDPLPTLLETLCDYVESLPGGLRCSIRIADPAGMLVHQAAPSLPSEFLRSIGLVPIRDGAGSCGTAAARRDMVVVEDVAESPLWDKWADLARVHGIMACWSVPIIGSGGDLLGTCGLYPAEPRTPDPAEIELMHFVASLAAVVMMRHRERAQRATDDAHYRQLADSTSDAVIVHGDGRIIYRNAAAARLLGLDDEWTMMPSLVDFIADDSGDPGRHSSGVRTRRLRRSDGSTVDVDVAATEMSMWGRRAVVWVCRDDTRGVSVERAALDASNREQEHLGYELHDGLGQQLTGLSLLLSALQRRITALVPDSAGEFEELAALLTQSIEDSRRLAVGLSPSAVDRAGLPGALAGLALLTKDFHCMDCQFKLDPAADVVLEPAVATHLYRIAQEAVHNIVRHARAQQTIIELSFADSMLVLSISDDGVGISDTAARGGGLGLRSMDYRARRIGTTVQVERLQPRGTRVRVAYPTGV